MYFYVHLAPVLAAQAFSLSLSEFLFPYHITEIKNA